MSATQRIVLICGRLFFGLLTLAAIITQLTIHIQNGFELVNFFSYFTNLSNILAALVFIVGALLLIQRRESSAAFDNIRGTAAVCMAVVGIVFSILLRNEDLGTLLPWVNFVLHYVMPVIVVLDWLYQPPATTLVVRQVGFWLIFPLAYLVYTLIRGSIVGFYPYPFLNPAKVGGYGGVALYCLGILVLFFILCWLLLFLANILQRNAVKRGMVKRHVA